MSFFILVVSISAQGSGPGADSCSARRAARSPTDEGAAAGADGPTAQRPLRGSGHAGAASKNQDRRYQQDDCLLHVILPRFAKVVVSGYHQYSLIVNCYEKIKVQDSKFKA
jgi:hypothetical protein